MITTPRGYRHRLLHDVAAWVIAFCVVAATRPGYAIPLELETNRSVTLPPGFEEVSGSGQSNDDSSLQTFISRGTNADSPPTYFTIRRVQAGAPETQLSPWSQSPDSFKVVGRYSERLYNLDLEVLDAEMKTNDMTMHRRSVQIPLRTDLFLLDLTTPAPRSNELDQIMKEVVKTIASQNPEAPQRAVQGYGNAIFCLVMVAMVILVAIARR